MRMIKKVNYNYAMKKNFIFYRVPLIWMLSSVTSSRPIMHDILDWLNEKKNLDGRYAVNYWDLWFEYDTDFMAFKLTFL